MKTKNIENLTKADFYDPVKEVTNVPRPIVAMAKGFQNGHIIPFHQQYPRKPPLTYT
jgi:hypothetical protein